ncbi:hypothetical protein ACFX2C_017726 [Malus domestica]
MSIFQRCLCLFTQLTTLLQTSPEDNISSANESSPLRILDQLEIDPLPAKQLGQVVCVGSILDISMHNSTQCVGAHRGVAFHNDDGTEDAVVEGLDERDMEMGKANEGGREERMG